jgi:hypothetical protein
MSSDTIYDSWEPSHVALISRSYLYALAPIGIGTAKVESLTGYIARLAAAHAVETGVLVNHELLPKIPFTKGIRAGQTPIKLPRYSFFLYAHTLNGIGVLSKVWVSVLEQLTRIQRLDLLTVLPWSHSISFLHLLRTNRAWCPYCYGEEKYSAQSAYEQLLWAFQSVTVCPNHRCPLESHCPTCGRTHYVFSSKSRPGYCSRCQCWLGRKPEPSTSDELMEQIHIAEMVGELLAKGPSFIAAPNLDFFRENIRNYVRGTGGNRQFRARIQRRHIRGWKQGRNAPSIDSLVVLSRSLNVPIVSLLTERISVADAPAHRRSSCAHFRIEDILVEEALRNALQAEIPPQLSDVANQLGYRSIRSLQYRYPGLCREITNRRQSWLRIVSPQAFAVSVPGDRIESALTAELGKAELTNLKEVALLIGLKSPRRFYKRFGDLTRAIVTKNKRIRMQRLGAIENALREAFYERPVPTVTEIARRLGFARVESVTSGFPELTTELRRRHPRRIVERTCRNNESVRQKMTEALLEFPPPSFTEVLKRVAVHPTKVRSDFPDLWRALRARYVQYKQDVLSRKRQAFADDIRRIVTQLHEKGMDPTPQLVLANMSEPQFRCRHAIAKAVRLARRELSIG